MQGLGEYEEALAWGGLACKATPLSTKPKEAERTMFVSTRIGMGMCLGRLGQWDDALRFFRAALRVPTKDPYVAVAQAHLRLAISDSWKKAWKEHEQRIGTDRSPVLPNVPEWDGKPTDGPVVVLHEQGIGDAVLFARWLPWIAE
ncbi:MAG: tetratricopeptide repeat protein, partial [Phycisphaerales bacterium]